MAVKLKTISRYGTNWGCSELEIELECIKRGGHWIGKQGQCCGEGLFQHYMAARRLLWPDRYRHRWTELMYENFIGNDVTILMGCASCVAGSTRLLNPQTGEMTPIEAFCVHGIQPVVMTLDGPELAGVPFVKGSTELLELFLSSGKRFTVAPEHRVLTPGGFACVSALSVGQELLAYDECPPKSSSATGPSESLQDVCRWWKTTQDYRDDCYSDCRPCDEPLHHAGGVGQSSLPLQDDVRKLTFRVLRRAGDRGPKLERSRLYEFAALPSSCSDPYRLCREESDAIGRSFSETSQYDDALSQSRVRLQLSTPLHPPFLPRDHGSIHSVTDYEMPCRNYRVSREHIASIRPAGPELYYDLEVPNAHHYFAEGAIHHNSQKTSHAVEYALISYLARPDNTLVVLSTTTMDKLDIGVWAELTMLWGAAKKLHDWLPGHIIPYKRAITTDNVQDGDVRDFRRGIICRPCKIGGRWVGLGTLAGVKQENILYVCDELQFMDESFSGSWPHLFSNGEVKIIGSGNPKHDPEDQLSITACPLGGWSAHPEPTKTEVWATKFMGAKCVNLVGTDSPNFDVPRGTKEPFRKLIGRRFEERMAHDHGRDSFEYYRLVKGVMKSAFALSRVITRQICHDHRALEGVTWIDDHQTRLYALDPSYGGEDRCVGGPLKFGMDVDGKQIIWVGPYRVFPISLQRVEVSVEDQIAETLAEELKTYDIDSENVFYDACGKGTIGAAFARKFGYRAPVAVDSGARPTKRPVRADLFVEENGAKRLKTCDEHYSKFVSEMWFSVRYTIEAGQLRGLLEDVMAEGCARIYNITGGNKIEVEPKTDPKRKEDLKRRLGKSPDLFDYLAIGVEGGRRLGFTIGRLGESVVGNEKEQDFFEEERKLYEEALKRGMLIRS